MSTSTTSDVDAVVRRSAEAFTHWCRTATSDRSAHIRELSSGVRGQAQELAASITASVGKTISQALSEVASVSEMLDYFAGEGERVKGDLPKLDLDGELPMVLKQPIGPVLALTPFNYPLALLSWKLGPALATGCTVVSKPHELAAAPQLLLEQIALSAGLPAGVFQVIPGGPDVGDELVRHPKIRKVAFTGGVETGSAVASTATSLGKRISLELGGQCPAIVWTDADLDKAIPSLVKHAFNNSGQYCYRINRVYCSTQNAQQVASRFAAAANGLVIGPPTEAKTQFGPLCSASLVDRAEAHVDDAVAKGAELLSGGERIDTFANEPFGDRYFAPTVLGSCDATMLVMNEETFGPVVGVQAVDSFDEAVALSNATEFGLAAYVFSTDLRRAIKAAIEIEAGSVWINDVKRAYAVMPFGGVKGSGVGREKSPYGLDEYLELKSVYLSY